LLLTAADEKNSARVYAENRLH